MRALFLANLGTPDAPTEERVRDYLAQFLMDPRVIDLPYPARWALVHGMILRTRPKVSAEAYRKIWTERGSPLLVHLKDLVAKVGDHLGMDWKVIGGMRYGNPSFRSGVRELIESGAEEVVFLPLFPQYSEATTLSALEDFRAALQGLGYAGRVREIQFFYERPEYVESVVQVSRPELAKTGADHVLFSFHGLPARQLRECGAACVCEGSKKLCYRAQCFATARELAKRLELSEDRFSVSFQSRLGRTEWIRPYTEEVYEKLAQRGVKRLAVVCPSFVADCLETLEEIRIRGRERWIELGGEDLVLIPSLNSEDVWARAVAGIALQNG